MKLLQIVVRLVPVVALCAACAAGPATPRQMYAAQTAQYTNCDDVIVDCADHDCSNMQGGSWTATACGQRYRCSNTHGGVSCIPLNDQKLPE